MNGLYLIDKPRSGAENMAMDQRMLELAAETDRPLLRIYQWARPTLSLGYFQKYGERLDHAPSSSIEVVRRATGGGAIVHHHDWTYSVAIPNRKQLGTNVQSRFATGASQAIYNCIHSAVVEWLGQKGFQAGQWNGVCNAEVGLQTDKKPKAKCSFLCFERRSSGDVVLGDNKVLGSAQRRLHGAFLKNGTSVQQGAVLQHGSLLLMRSSYAPSLPGLRELGASSTLSPVDLLDFAVRLRDAIAAFTERKFEEASDAHHFLTEWKPQRGREPMSWTGKR